MKPWVAVILLVSAAAAALAGKATETITGTEFRKSPYTLVVAELNAESELNLADPAKSKHTISLSGALTAPPRRDAVAVRSPLKVLRAVDGQQQDLLAPTKKRPPAASFTMIHQKTQQGQLELGRTVLTANPYTIRSMTVETELILAGKRVSRQLDPAVMDEAVDVVDGLTIRINSVKLSDKGELTVSADYTRAAAGRGGAFLEAVYAIDENGKKVGGGRWMQGDPFGNKGRITAEFALGPGATHKKLRFVAVTESRTETIAFTLTKIFQQ